MGVPEAIGAQRWGDEIGPLAGGALAVAVGAALLAAAPTYPGLGIAPSGDLPMLFTALAALAMTLAGVASRRGFIIPGKRAMLVLGGFLVIALVSTAASEFAPFAVFGSPTTRLGVITTVPLLALLVFARGFSTEIAGILRRVAPWIVGAWLLGMVYQWLAVDFEPWGLSSNNALSAQIILLLLPAMLTLAGRRRWLRLVAGLAVAAMLWWASSAMGVALALLWTAADAFLTTGRLRQLPKKALLAAPVLHLLLSVVLIASALAGIIPGPATGGRTGIWRLALDTYASAPVAGVGPDVLLHVSPPYLSAASAQVVWDQPIISASAHALWLDIAVSYGGAMVVLVLAALVLLMGSVSVRVNAPGFPFLAGLGLYGLTLLIQPFGLQTMPVLVLAVVASLPATVRSARRAGVTLAVVSGAAALVLLAFALTCVSVGRPDYRPGSLETARSAAELWEYEPELWAQTAYRYGMAIGSPSGGEAAIAGMETALMRAIDLVPKEPQYRLELARSSEAVGRDSEIVSERYASAVASFPLGAEVNYWRGIFLARQGNAEGARESYAVLTEYYPTWSGTQQFAAECAELGVKLD